MSAIDQAPPSRHVGRELRRKEDPRLITGRARYIDDISLGAKGVGEAGTSAASAAVTNAVRRPETARVDYINMPLSPMRVRDAISSGQGASPEGGPGS
ncbi:MAG: hypothetical protein WAL63_08560 [Solirubrobacteraceae bacterium]